MSTSPIRALLAALCLLIPLTACQWQSLSAKQDAELRTVFEQFQKGDLQAIETSYDPQYRTPALHEHLATMHDMVPPGTPGIQRLNTAVQTDKQGRTDYGASYEYDFPGHGLLVQIEKRQDAAGRTTITALDLRGAPKTHLVDDYRFSLTGRKPAHFIYLFLFMLSPALGLWGMTAVWRAPDIGRRWKPIWTLAMMMGFMDLTLNWHDGTVTLQTAHLHILYDAVSKFGPLSPWMLSTSLPLASIAFLLGYRPPKKTA